MGGSTQGFIGTIIGAMVWYAICTNTGDQPVLLPTNNQSEECAHAA